MANYLTETPLTLRDKLFNYIYGQTGNRTMAKNVAGDMSGNLSLFDLTGIPLGEEAGRLTGEGVATGDLGNASAGLGLLALGTLDPLKVGKVAKPVVTKVTDTGKSLLGKFPTTTAGRILHKTKKGGYSVNLPTGNTPETGYMVGIYKNDDPRNTVLDKLLTKKDIEQAVNKNKKQLNKEDIYLGSWMNEGQTYIEPSKRFTTEGTDALRKATKFGEKTNQKALFDAALGKEYPVGNWAEFIQSPEYGERLGILNKEGIEYLKKHPQKDWWNLKNTELEEIYGKENRNKIAGYLAATSPLSDVGKNVRLASEYMRRDIKGEPIIQPLFTIPENAVGFQAGLKMPLEKSYTPNLERVLKGDINQMQSQKVRGMAQALTGDPNAMVFDRHWAKLSEKPTAGIYTDVTKNTFPAGKQYDDLEKIVAKTAKKTGLTPAEFSANVWTGYRNKAQTEGKVFGEKVGAGILSESKGIADIFSDIVTDNAKKLKMTRKELIEKMKKGDISLLSLLPPSLVYQDKGLLSE